MAAGTRRVAIACQGGGTHTAFTAGVLEQLLRERGEGEKNFEILALSGTSGGAVCALFAWLELLAGGPSGKSSRLGRFWRQPYPDGNAAAPYPVALARDWSGLWSGGLPFQSTLDRLRNDGFAWFSSFFSLPLLDTVPFYAEVGLHPYFFQGIFERAGVWEPYRRLFFEGLRNGAALLPPPVRAFAEHGLSLLAEYPDALRNELDVQTGLRTLLQRNLTAEDLGLMKEKRSAGAASPPELLVGAVDVRKMRPYKKGRPDKRENRTNFKVFRAGEESPGDLVDAVVASAAMPTLMRAVSLNGSAYWDGLFSQNPPISDLPDICGEEAGSTDDKGVQEIWIVLINPFERDALPVRAEDILDRRNELAGNISLLQEVRAIERMDGKTVNGRYYRPVELHFIEMGPEFAEGLKTWTKLDRRLESVEKLMDHGAERAHAFLAQWRQSP